MRPSWRCETHRGQVVEYRLDRLSHLVEAARKGKVAIEIALITGGPGEAPPHPLAIPQELVDRRSGDRDQRHVPSLQVRDQTVERVGDGRVHRAAVRIARTEHELVDEHLRAGPRT